MQRDAAHREREVAVSRVAAFESDPRNDAILTEGKPVKHAREAEDNIVFLRQVCVFLRDKNRMRSLPALVSDNLTVKRFPVTLQTTIYSRKTTDRTAPVRLQIISPRLK